MTSPEEELEALRDETREKPRAASESGPSEDDEDAELEELIESLTAVRDGDRTPSIGVRDAKYAAYLDYLKANPEHMEDVGDQLAAVIDETDGVNPPSVDHTEKAGILKLLLVVGMIKGVPDEFDFLGDAEAEYHRRNP